MKLSCPVCGPNTAVHGKTCRKCKTTWESEKDYYMDGYYRCYRAALSFLPKKPPEKLSQLNDALELLQMAWRFLKEAEKS